MGVQFEIPPTGEPTAPSAAPRPLLPPPKAKQAWTTQPVAGDVAPTKSDQWADTRSYLTQIAPIDGVHYISVHDKLTGSDGACKDGMRGSGSPFKTAQEVVANLDWRRRSGRDKDVYLCMSSQRETVTCQGNNGPYKAANRKRENAAFLKSFFVDLDVGKKDGYADAAQALDALAQACDAIPLPHPNVFVNSGGGFHAYWSLNKLVSIDDWQPIANALVEAMCEHGLKFDSGCSVDATRILRIPGTVHNKDPKTPKPVTLVKCEPYVFTLEHIANPVSPWVGKNTHVTHVSRGNKTDKTDVNDELSGGIAVHKAPPRNPDLVASVCPFFDNARRTHGEHHDNPRWFDALNLANFCVGDVELAHEVSSGHPAYHPDETAQEFERIRRTSRGPVSCKAIRLNGAEECKTCPRFADTTSPVNFPDVAKGSATAINNGLSFPYYHDAVGNVCVDESDEGNEGDETQHTQVVCSYMKVLYRTTDLAGGTVSLIVEAKNPHGELHQVRVSIASLATDPRTGLKPLIDAGVTPTHVGPVALAHIARAILHAEAPLARFVTKSGFHTFNGETVFALPSGVLGTTRNETVIWDGVSNLCQAARGGTMERWLDNVAKLCGGNPLLIATVGTMLSSVTIRYMPAGFEINTTLHLCGETSKGKTTALRVGGSVWGKGAAAGSASMVRTWRTTDNAMEATLEAHTHIGVILDELGVLAPSAAAAVAYLIAGGVSKDRMRADTSSREPKKWELFVLSSGERTISDHANDGAFKRKTLAAGTEARIINIMVQDIFQNLHGSASPAEFAKALGAAGASDYGHAGPAFVEWLLVNETAARERLKVLARVWAEFTDRLLAPDTSAQGGRVASRLGSIACGAALAAGALQLPWVTSDGLQRSISKLVGQLIAPAECATMAAFVTVLKNWMRQHGGKDMTSVAALKQQLREFYASRPSAFLFKATDRSEPTDKADLMRECFGVVVGGGFADARVIDFIDFLPAALRDVLGWSDTERDTVMRSLADDGSLILPAVKGKTQTSRRLNGTVQKVYRVKGDFFTGDAGALVTP